MREIQRVWRSYAVRTSCRVRAIRVDFLRWQLILLPQKFKYKTLSSAVGLDFSASHGSMVSVFVRLWTPTSSGVKCMLVGHSRVRRVCTILMQET